MYEDSGSLLASYAVTQDTPHVPLKASGQELLPPHKQNELQWLANSLYCCKHNL